MPAGRPSDYSVELAEAFCDRLAESDFGVEQVCEADDMPSPRSIWRWLEKHDEFRQMYARAKEVQGHVQADRAVRDAVQAKDAQLGRLAYDARKWQAAKLAPKTYSEKLEVEHGGGLGLTVNIVHQTPPPDGD